MFSHGFSTPALHASGPDVQRRGLAGLIAMLSLALSLVAQAQPSAQASFLFALPSQPLHDALLQYSQVTGRSVLYDTRHVQGRMSAAVAGRLTPDEALHRLIDGSGMEAHFAGPDAFMLVPEAASAQAGGRRTAGKTSAEATLPQFYGQLQYVIGRTLCANAGLSPGAYRLALRLRIGPSGELAEVAAHATGHRQLEPRIVQTLTGMRLGVAPPPELPQPVLLLVRPDSGQGCAP